MSRAEAILAEKSSHPAEVDRLQAELVELQVNCSHNSVDLVSTPYEPNRALGCTDIYLAERGTMICREYKHESTCVICPSCETALSHDSSAMERKGISELDGWRAGNSVRELNGGECPQCGRMYVWLGREIEW